MLRRSLAVAMLLRVPAWRGVLVDVVITGPTTPVLTVTLAEGESVVAESGELSWLGGDVTLETGRNVGMSQGGFLKSASLCR